MPNSEYGNGGPVRLSINSSDSEKLRNVYARVYGNGNSWLNTDSQQFFKEKYYYDASSNIRYIENNLGVISSSFDAENRLVKKGAASFSYDANGNMLSENAGKDRTYYSYSADNRLVRVVKPVDQQEKNLRIADFSYDALGRRVSRVQYENHQNSVQLKDYSVYTYSGNGLDITGKMDYKGQGSNWVFEREREYIYALGSAVSQREFDRNGYNSVNERK